jgi:MFS family permease
VPSQLRRQFFIAAAIIATAYSHGVLILSIGGQVAHDLVGSSTALINGLSLALFPIAGGVTGALGRRLLPFGASAAGAVASSAAMILMVLAVGNQSLALLLVSISVAGVGYSLLFSGGLGLVNEIAPEAHRGAMLSGLYLFGYLAMGFVALAIGVIATYFGLKLAVYLGAATISLLGLASLFGYIALEQSKGTLKPLRRVGAASTATIDSVGSFKNHP